MFLFCIITYIPTQKILITNYCLLKGSWSSLSINFQFVQTLTFSWHNNSKEGVKGSKKKTVLALESFFSRKRSSEHHLDGLMAPMSNDSKQIFLQKSPENDGLLPTILVSFSAWKNKYVHCHLHNIRNVPMLCQLYCTEVIFCEFLGENINVINHEWIRFTPGQMEDSKDLHRHCSKSAMIFSLS